MMDSGCKPINEEEFLLQLQHFENSRSIGKCVLIPYEHASHSKNIQVLGFDKENDKPIILYVYQPTACTDSRHFTKVSLLLKVDLNYFSEHYNWLKNNLDSRLATLPHFSFPKQQH
jgi:hypothetical protein